MKKLSLSLIFSLVLHFFIVGTWEENEKKTIDTKSIYISEISLKLIGADNGQKKQTVVNVAKRMQKKLIHKRVNEYGNKDYINKFQSYFHSQIKVNSRILSIKGLKQIVLELSVDRFGNISHRQLKKGSGVDFVDEYFVNQVKSIGRFMPFPVSLKVKNITLEQKITL